MPRKKKEAKLPGEDAVKSAYKSIFDKLFMVEK